MPGRTVAGSRRRLRRGTRGHQHSRQRETGRHDAADASILLAWSSWLRPACPLRRAARAPAQSRRRRRASPTRWSGSSARMPLARQDRPARHAVDPGHLRRRRRPGVRQDRALGRLAPRRRPHRLDRLAARHRRQAQHAAAARARAAADRVRPRGRHRAAAHRRHRVPHQYGRGGDRAGPGRLRDGTDHGARGPRRRHPPRASRRWPTSTTTPPTRSSTPARSARTRVRSQASSSAEVRGLQDHGMLATAKHFPGSRRHRDRFAPRAAGDRRALGPARLASSWCRSGAPSRRA